jgi:hypothetical protein
LVNKNRSSAIYAVFAHGGECAMPILMSSARREEEEEVSVMGM